MKRLIAIAVTGVVLLGTSCKKYLDINTNPNSATSTTPQLILPQALTSTASTLNGYNTNGAQLGGFSANAGGYGGFGVSITYSFGATDWNGLWSSAYDNLEDYQAIINYTDAQAPTYNYFNAVAKIMKAFDYQLLVDTYNDVPYTEALKGSDNLTPKYDKAADIYASLATLIDSAIARIDAGASASGVTPLGSSDVLFHGNMTKWKQFANTIKLRLLVRGNGKATFANSTFSSDGFLTADALINPGYTRDNGKQNPAWSSWAFSYTGSDANKAWIPSTYIMGMYDGNTLIDSNRGKAIYYQFPNTGTNQLGYENVNISKCPSGSFWYSGSNRSGSSAGSAPGILKGPDASYPAMLAAESYFLQAEAVVRGIISGDATSLFDKGIAASYNYLYKLSDNTTNYSSADPAADAAAYKVANPTSYLVNLNLANTTEKKIEAIITQKYIALNYISSHEAWNDYRRTQYPAIKAGGNAHETFASIVSESTRPDKLPTRILYPASEAAYNPANAISVTPFTSLIFWAKQ